MWSKLWTVKLWNTAKSNFNSFEILNWFFMQFRQWQKHKRSSQQKEAGRKETNLPQKIKKREKKQKKKQRRYMKSSCRWTTIHFHFEVLRAVVKCDCMWQLPSLPVYHDGYTLPTWWFCSTCAHSCTHTNTWIQRHKEVCRHVYTNTETTRTSQILYSYMLAHWDKVISDPLSNCTIFRKFQDFFHSV